VYIGHFDQAMQWSTQVVNCRAVGATTPGPKGDEVCLPTLTSVRKTAAYRHPEACKIRVPRAAHLPDSTINIACNIHIINNLYRNALSRIPNWHPA
jgi:hypothetical protein